MYQKAKELPQFADLKAVLSQSQIDNTTYQTIEGLIDKLTQTIDIITGNIEKAKQDALDALKKAIKYVAYTNEPNVFTVVQKIENNDKQLELRGSPTPALHLHNPNEGGDNKIARLGYIDRKFRVDFLNDAESAEVGGSLVLDKITAALTIIGQYLGPNGNVNAPTYSFTSSLKTGMWWDPSSPGFLKFSVNGRPQVAIRHDTDINYLYVENTWNINGPGSKMIVGRNFKGAGAAGTISLISRDGSGYVMWIHNGILRIGGAAPTMDDTAPHTGGVAVGDQTSSLESKNLIRERLDNEAILQTVRNTRIYDFDYKDGRYNGESFTGAVTDESPWIGKDQNRALNEINGFGYLIGSVKALTDQLDKAMARIKELEEKVHG